MVSDIIEPYPPPPFFDIREPYIVSSPLCNWGGGGSRIQTEYVSVGMFCEILVEGTKRWGFYLLIGVYLLISDFLVKCLKASKN